MPELDNTAQVIDTAPPPVGATQESAPAVVTDKPAEPVNWESAADAEMAAIFRKNNPERADDGKFASRDAEGKTEELTDQAQVKPEDQPVAVTPAPTSWSAEAKELWPTLSPKAQEVILKREKDASEAITRQGQEISQFEPVKSVIEQHKDIFERNGLDYSDGLGRMLNAERMLERDPVAAIGMIAQAYGVDLRQLGAGTQQPPNSAEAALHQRIAHLESQLNDTVTRVQTREQAEAVNAQKTNLSLIEKFASDKPDWADLETDILTEITGIKAAIQANLMQPMTPPDILQKAYERAQRNNPAAWEKAQAAAKKADDDKRTKEAAERTEAAKRAKQVNVASSPANGHTVGTMDETLKQAYRKANAA